MKLENYLLTESKTASPNEIASVAKMTDINDHFGARIYICQLLKNKQLEDVYTSLETAHQKYNAKWAISARSDLDMKTLKKEIMKNFTNGKELWMAM